MNVSVGFVELKDYAGYGVSADGHVWSRKSGRWLRPIITWAVERGRPAYARVRLHSQGQSRQHRIHLPVLEAFQGPRPAGHVANHRDGNKWNNSADNLEWVTPSENNCHALPDRPSPEPGVVAETHTQAAQGPQSSSRRGCARQQASTGADHRDARTKGQRSGDLEHTGKAIRHLQAARSSNRAAQEVGACAVKVLSGGCVRRGGRRVRARASVRKKISFR